MKTMVGLKTETWAICEDCHNCVVTGNTEREANKKAAFEKFNLNPDIMFSKEQADPTVSMCPHRPCEICGTTEPTERFPLVISRRIWREG